MLIIRTQLFGFKNHKNNKVNKFMLIQKNVLKNYAHWKKILTIILVQIYFVHNNDIVNVNQILCR